MYCPSCFPLVIDGSRMAMGILEIQLKGSCVLDTSSLRVLEHTFIVVHSTVISVCSSVASHPMVGIISRTIPTCCPDDLPDVTKSGPKSSFYKMI